MEKLEITSMSSRGQVVIPLDIRQQLKLKEGEKFMVIQQGEMLILKRVMPPSKAEIEEMFRRSHEHAKKHNLTEKDMWDAITRVRAKKQGK